MANAYSLLHNYDQPLFQPNVGLIANVLEYKQNKLDTNRMQLQSAIDQYGSLDMIRGVDKEYANKRMEEVLNVANKYAGSDLTDARISTGLQAQVEQFMDDNVMSAVASTRLIRAEDAEWEQQRIKNPEKYSDLNKAYAAQAREPYLNNQEVGAAYRGGGGFMEYTDVNKLIQDNIMNIQKATHSEYVQTGAQDGYFRSLDTKEVVDRGRMESAIDALFGEKEKNQLRINAWGGYSQAPEEAIRQEYDQYIGKKTKEIDGTLDTLRQMKASKTNPEDIAIIQNSIEAYQRDKNGFMANSNFDAVMQAGGRTTINNLLYTENLKDNFLNAYSYEPITLKHEIDEVDQANRKFQLELDKFEQAKLEFNVETELKMQKAVSTAKAGTNALGNVLERTPITGDLVEMSTDNPEAALKNYNDEKYKSMENIADIFGISPDDSAKMLELQQLLSTDISEKSILKFNGKTVDLSSPESKERNRAAKILKFQTYMSGNDPLTKRLEKRATDFAFEQYDDLTKLFVAGGFADRDFDSRDLRNFGFKLVKSGDKFKVVDMDAKQAKNYYLNLMKKGDNLTESELATKKAYALAHPILDTEIDNQPEFKRLLGDTYNKYLMANVAKEDLNKVIMPNDNKYAENYGTDTIELDYSGLTPSQEKAKRAATFKLIKRGYINKSEAFPNKASVSEPIKDKVSAYLSVSIKQSKALAEGDTDKAKSYSAYMNRMLEEMAQAKRYNPAENYRGELELSDIAAKDAEAMVTNKGATYYSLADGRTRGLNVGFGEELSVESFATRMTEGLRDEVAVMNQDAEGRYKDLQLTTQVFTKDLHKDIFKVIAAKVDQVNPVKVEFERELNAEGEYEGTVKYTSVNSKGEIVEGRLTQASLSADGVPLSLGKIERNPYTASYGDDATSVNLGRGVFDKLQLSNSEQVHVEELKVLYTNLAEAYPEHATRINNEYSNYESGKYSFSLEANGRTYDQVLRGQDGEVLHRVPTDFTELTDKDLQNAINQSIDLRDGIFLAYMNDIVGLDIYRTNSVAPKLENRNFRRQ